MVQLEAIFVDMNPQHFGQNVEIGLEEIAFDNSLTGVEQNGRPAAFDTAFVVNENGPTVLTQILNVITGTDVLFQLVIASSIALCDHMHLFQYRINVPVL